MSLCFWFTVYTTPAIMIFPELNEILINLHWINEVVWVLEIIRKVHFNVPEGEEAMEAAMLYIKSSMILDIVATLPQIASLMN